MTGVFWRCKCDHALYVHGRRVVPNAGIQEYTGCRIPGCGCTRYVASDGSGWPEKPAGGVQLDLNGGETPVEALDWPAALREIARREQELGSRLDPAEAGALIHALEGKHPADQTCPYDGRIGSEALARLRRREGAAGEQARSPRLADNSPAVVPRARATDPVTSDEAAASVAPADLRASQVAILCLFLERGAMTDVRLVELYTGLMAQGVVKPQSQSGIRTRRAELVDLALLRDTGEKAILEESGRRAIIWDLTRAGADGWQPSRVAGAIESPLVGGTPVREEVCEDPEPEL